MISATLHSLHALIMEDLREETLLCVEALVFDSQAPHSQKSRQLEGQVFLGTKRGNFLASNFCTLAAQGAGAESWTSMMSVGSKCWQIHSVKDVSHNLHILLGSNP